MNQRTQNILDGYKPELAIVVYKANSAYFYLESHAIGADGKLCEGKPLTEETISGMVDVFYNNNMQSSTIGGVLPENMLHFSALPAGRYKMMWYRPAEKRMLYFNEGLHITNGMAWVPAMVYMVEGRELSVYALNEDERPTENTVLYHAPFHNVNVEGEVCLGSAKANKPKDKTFANLCKYYEDLFWMSEFTHLNHENRVKGNLNLIWMDLIQNDDKKWSDIDELVTMDDIRGPKRIKDLL